ncbi:MAG: hypothetical protein RSA62_05955 [Oscillospiraceae bacterium]
MLLQIPPDNPSEYFAVRAKVKIIVTWAAKRNDVFFNAQAAL